METFDYFIDRLAGYRYYNQELIIGRALEDSRNTLYEHSRLCGGGDVQPQGLTA
jgi:hypothetical protein